VWREEISTDDESMTEGDDKPHETRRDQGRREGRSWASTAPLEEKVRLWEVLPDPDIEHYSRCAQIAVWLKQEFTDPERPQWPTLFPLLESRGLPEILTPGDVWLAGFVDGALDVMGFKPQAD